MAEIGLRQVVKRFGGETAAVGAIDLTVTAGELLVVLGPSGSGKTTLLRLIAGLESPTAGAIEIGGRAMTGIPPHRRDVAMVFQNPALYPHLTVSDNLAFGLRARGVPRAAARSEVATVAGLLGLDHLLDRRPSALSGGERQRVAIGRAIGRRPRVLLLDEPFSGLDLPLRAALRAEVVELQRRLGMTLVHVTHDQGEALSMGDRVAILERGRLLQCGPPRAIYARPQHRFVATFVGNPPMNILPCTIEREEGTVRIRPIDADLAPSWSLPADAMPPGRSAGMDRIQLGLRPESIVVGERGVTAATSTSSPTFSAQVRRLEFTGAEVWATLALGPHRLVARLPTGHSIRDRQDVPVAFELEQASWFDPATGLALNAEEPRGTVSSG